MILDKILFQLQEINRKLDALHVPAQPEAQEKNEKTPFKLDDAKMQEGIANLMGYDPFCKKRSEETWQ